MTVTVTLSSKGQITLPVAMREELGLVQGDRLTVTLDRRGLILRKQLSFDDITALAQKWMKPGVEPLMDASAFYQENREIT